MVLLHSNSAPYVSLQDNGHALAWQLQRHYTSSAAAA